MATNSWTSVWSSYSQLVQCLNGGSHTLYLLLYTLSRHLLTLSPPNQNVLEDLMQQLSHEHRLPSSPLPSELLPQHCSVCVYRWTLIMYTPSHPPLPSTPSHLSLYTLHSPPHAHSNNTPSHPHHTHLLTPTPPTPPHTHTTHTSSHPHHPHLLTPTPHTHTTHTSSHLLTPTLHTPPHTGDTVSHSGSANKLVWIHNQTSPTIVNDTATSCCVEWSIHLDNIPRGYVCL